MIHIYNSRGQVNGWIYNKFILDNSNTYKAFINNDKVYSLYGKYLGEFSNGYFWDKNGAAVAYIEGAKKGPLLPLKAIPPISPIPPIPPIPAIPEIPPIPPIHSLSWSRQTFEVFLNN